ncbi:hypothetical protein, partial [Aliarcobacter butzleri]|uniref:hypothetical protein n=1 Tax=Aliarcobacter butzleri TaxID=28197 RepID=UPI00126A3EDC
MKNKLLISIFSLFMTTSVFSAEGKSTLLEQLRAEKVEVYKNNLDAIAVRVNNYILNSADTTVDRREVQTFDNLPYQFFNNFENVSCVNDGTYCGNQTGQDGIQLSLNSKSIILKNVLGNGPNTFVVQAFTSNNDNSRVVTKEDNYTVTIPLDTKTANFLSLIEKIKNIPDAYIGTTPPSDTTKTWYFPNGTGGFDIKKWNPETGKWETIGSTGTNGQSSVQAPSEEELFKIPCIKNDIGFVIESVATEYICTDNGEWIPKSTGGSMFNGASDMLSLVTKLMKKTGGSVANVSDPNETAPLNGFTGVIDFTKKDNTANNGYWIDSTNRFVATDSYATLSTINLAANSFGYIPNEDKTKVLTLKRIDTGNGLSWIYVANGYKDIVQNFNFVPTDKAYVLNLKNNENFYYKREAKGTLNSFVSFSTPLVEHNNLSPIRISIAYDNRDAFNPRSNSQHLLVFDDCASLSNSCNGASNTFVGAKVDGMFAFYYAPTSPKKKNGLTDAKPYPNMGGLYDGGAEAGIVDGTIFIKDSINSSICYKDSSGVYYTRAKVKIPTGNLLPPARTCTTAVYTATNGSGFGTYLVLDNRVQATDWTTVPDGAGINVLGKNYTYDNTGGLDYWTDNLTMALATEIFTKGSRSSFPNVTKSLTALTINVGSEPRYTASGVQSTIDSNFKQWFYSNSGTNNLVDGIPTTNAYLDSNAISV